MALTRKFLRAMGIEDEKIEQIIEAHSETVDGLKEDIATHKANSEKLEGVQKELDELKAKGDDGYREKYEKEHSDFEAYKADIEKKEAHAAKERAYRDILKSAGIKDKFIDTVMRAEQSTIDALELTDGNFSEPEKLTASVKEAWADFVAVTETRAAGAATPPNNNYGDISKDDFSKMSYRDRLKLYNENQALYNKLTT